MKNILYILALVILSCSRTNDLPNVNLLQNGDLIFQTSISPQSLAIQLATHSPYSHVGIIYKQARQIYVLEAVQPVKLTILAEWIKRGEDGHYVIKRLKDANQILTPTALQKMNAIANKMTYKLNQDSPD